jgi:hypothetical protein
MASKLAAQQATVPWSMTSQKIQLRESVIIANRKDIMLNLAHRRINSSKSQNKMSKRSMCKKIN